MRKLFHALSLGQVYKAQLKYSGKLVIVKVQRPGIEEAIGLDFYLIRGLGFLINKYVDIITSDVVFTFNPPILSPSCAGKRCVPFTNKFYKIFNKYD